MALTLNFNKLNSKQQFRLVSVMIFLLAFVLYGNSISNGYSVDDYYVTFENPRVQEGLAGIPDIFTSHHVQDARVSFGYRPVVLSTFAIEYQFFGLNPQVSHFINILLYILTCILLYLLLVRIMPKVNPLLPILTVLLFLIHPVHTEVVNNLKSRDELLCFIGAILATLAFLKYYDTNKISNVLIGLLWIVFALFSKLTIIVFLVLIPLALYIFRPTNWKKIGVTFGSIFIVLGTLALAKGIALPEPTLRVYGYTENPLFFEENFWARIPAGLYALGYYLRLLVFPHPLSFYYGYDAIPIAGWDNAWVYLSLLFHTGIFVYAIYLLPKKHILSFAILFYLIAISMFANIVEPVVGIIADRFLYIASFGFCLALSYILLQVFSLKPLTLNKYNKIPASLAAILVAILLLSSYKVISRNSDWQSEMSLFTADVESVENSARVNALLAYEIHEGLKDIPNEQERAVQAQKALHHYNRALEIYPYSTLNWNHLGSLYTYMNQKDKAKESYRKAIEIDPQYEEAYFGLGLLHEYSKEPNTAIDFYSSALNINPEYYEAYSRMGFIYYNLGKVNEAANVYKVAIEKLPKAYDFYINLGNIYLDNQQPQRALQYYEQVYAYNETDAQLLQDMAKAYMAVGNTNKASEFEQKARLAMQTNPKKF